MWCHPALGLWVVSLCLAVLFQKRWITWVKAASGRYSEALVATSKGNIPVEGVP